MEVTNFYVQDGAYPAYSLDGINWESGDYSVVLRKAGTNIQEVFAGIASHYHVKMAKDAGGTVVAQTPGWYGSLNETVRIPLQDMQAFAARLVAERNPHAGMMETSTGEWVLADDWDAIEGA